MRAGPVWLLAGIAVVYLALVAPQIHKPLMYDDANFAQAIEATARTGVPYGNQGWMSERGDYSQRDQWALWHPPLYIYLAAAIVKLVGASPAALRSLGVLAGVATIALTCRLAADLTRGPPRMRSAAGISAAALVAVCPLFVQSSLILDIDFALLLPLVLLFLVLYVKYEQRRAPVLLTGLFGALLWTKMTNPPAVLAVTAVWQTLRGHWRRAGVHVVGIGIGGGILFGATWVGVGRTLGFPLDMPFSVNAVEWQDSADIARRAYAGPNEFVSALSPTILWIGPSLVALGLLAVIGRGALLLRAWRFVRADLVIGLLAIFVLGYINKHAGWFPKYEVAMVPLLACLAAPVLAAAACAAPRLALGLVALTTCVTAVMTHGMVRDTWALDRTWSISGEAALALGCVVMVGTLAGLVVRKPGLGACAALIGVSLGWSLAIDLIQLRAPYATTYWYGTLGTADAADWATAHVAPDELYLAAKEVAIRSRATGYVDQENVWSILASNGTFDGTWRGQPLRTLITWQRDPAVESLWQRASLASLGFGEVARFGDYVIYTRPPS